MLSLGSTRKGPNMREVGHVSHDLKLTQANNLEHYEMNDNTLAFYSHEVLGHGQRYLVAKTLQSKTKTWEDIIQLMDDEEAEHECNMAKFVNSLTRSQTHEFSNCLTHIKKIYSIKECSVLGFRCKWRFTFLSTESSTVRFLNEKSSLYRAFILSFNFPRISFNITDTILSKQFFLYE